ncbi:hypothetical protein HPB51_007733 [Rhipicephalus microplus]|uniref:Uncharacterized protein n=1 Tax=Rhipicephalus microplus TaxID=6941 RepID=A0A9J6DTA8_RHIMP|nr:hypothetical protein HPB51_007733 [Rhipicephalus microplus]
MTELATVIQVHPPAVTTDPLGVPAVDGPEENAEGIDEALGHDTMPRHPDAAFLKDATGALTTGNPRRKRNKNRRRGRTVPSLQSTAVSPPSSRSQCTQTTTTGHPLHSALPSYMCPPPTSETVDDEGFQTVRSKSALRRTRNRTSAALSLDPAVVGMVLYQPASAGGSFRNFLRLTIAQALSLRPGVVAILVNQHCNVVAVDVSSHDCLEQLLALTELKGNSSERQAACRPPN